MLQPSGKTIVPIDLLKHPLISGFKAPKHAHGFKHFTNTGTVLFGTRQYPVLATIPFMSIPALQYVPIGQGIQRLDLASKY